MAGSSTTGKRHHAILQIIVNIIQLITAGDSTHEFCWPRPSRVFYLKKRWHLNDYTYLTVAGSKVWFSWKQCEVVRCCRDKRRCSKMKISLLEGEVKPITVTRRAGTGPLLPTLIVRTTFDLCLALNLSTTTTNPHGEDKFDLCIAIKLYSRTRNSFRISRRRSFGPFPKCSSTPKPECASGIILSYL